MFGSVLKCIVFKSVNTCPERMLCTRIASSFLSVRSQPLLRRRLPKRAGRPLMARAEPTSSKHVWALDFDGVICDSVGELAIAAWKASVNHWPEIFSKPEVASRRAEIMHKLKVVRPVIETGYENLVLIRCMLDGTSTDSILEDWHPIRDEYMKQHDLDRTDLLDTFGATRDKMMQDDLQAWIDLNRIYAGITDCIRRLIQDHEFYVVTTKQARFTEAILHRLAGIDLPSERIFSQAESGAPKYEILELLEQRHPNTKYYFVEDKALTLHKVVSHPELKDWALLLVDWGYNTDEEKQEARDHRRIRLISLDDFHELALQ